MTVNEDLPDIHTDDGEELVQQILKENPPEEIGLREEWKDHVGWHRTEDIHSVNVRGRQQERSVPHENFHRRLRGVDSSGSKSMKGGLSQELGPEVAWLANVAIGLAGLAVILLLFLLFDWIRSRIRGSDNVSTRKDH